MNFFQTKLTQFWKKKQQKVQRIPTHQQNKVSQIRGENNRFSIDNQSEDKIQKRFKPNSTRIHCESEIEVQEEQNEASHIFKKNLSSLVSNLSKKKTQQINNESKAFLPMTQQIKAHISHLIRKSQNHHTNLAFQKSQQIAQKMQGYIQQEVQQKDSSQKHQISMNFDHNKNSKNLPALTFEFPQIYHRQEAQQNQSVSQQPEAMAEESSEMQMENEQPTEDQTNKQDYEQDYQQDYEQEEQERDLTIVQMILQKKNVSSSQIRYTDQFQFLIQSKNQRVWIGTSEILKLNPQWLQEYYKYWL